MIERLRRRIATSERQGGFTLIELLVVIVIIGVLLGIAIPSYLGFKARAEQATASSNVRAAVPAAEAFYSDNGTYNNMNLAALQAIDQGIPDGLVVNETDSAYCLQFTKGTKVASYAGPGGALAEVACS